MEARSNSVVEPAGTKQKQEADNLGADSAPSRRRHTRYPFARTADWDFFTSGSGTKPGYLEDVSEGGCLLRTADPIEHRRWIRLVVKQPQENLWFTAVGRVIRREDRMEAWDEQTVTLYRYGVEFIHAMNPLVIERIQSACVKCSSCGDTSASIPDPTESGKIYCVLCHLRRACHNLLTQDHFDPAEPA